MKTIWKWIRSLLVFLRLLDRKHYVYSIRRRGPRMGPMRNKKCWCGSGRKYKRCHWFKDYPSGVYNHASN